MVWFKSNRIIDDVEVESGKLLETTENQSPSTTIQNNQNAPKEQDEDIPMDLGDLQDIFSFNFMKGRPIGLPILLYEILKPHVGQVVAMIIASSPPLAIVIWRMLKERMLDSFGLIAGISFLISGILSIVQPDDQVSAICESLVSLFVGVCCVISVIPIRIGKFEFKPLVFEFTNQVMPRTDQSERLQKHDDARITKHTSPTKRLDYLYTHMAKFRRDMRVMTLTWGLLLIIAFIVKVIVVMTNTDMFKAQMYGYIIFGLTAFVMMIFTWFYTNVVKGHVFEQVQFWKEQREHPIDGRTEALHNANWGVQTLNNTFAQVIG
ncbi:hypothetical protein K501DRAFT_295502 [Backusella circina FSU 941]|nr:hypothetical protein K501DRAFT_295502 [Backusella circina FSU 941]